MDSRAACTIDDEDSVEAEPDRRRIERRAILECDALAQGKVVLQSVIADRVALSQPWNNLCSVVSFIPEQHLD